MSDPNHISEYPWLQQIPKLEWEEKKTIISEIDKLKKQRDALILGHNYMEPALYHSVADVTGDSLELCRQAATTGKPVLVFCGVEFMAETAKIINPTSQVLIPSQKAGCSLASSITAEDVRALKRSYPGVPVVSYVNTYAEIKAETDVCCTSGNASHIVNTLNSDTVIFIPDEYLARNIAKETGKHVIFPSKDPRQNPALETSIQKIFIGWHGKCEVHDKFETEDIAQVREQFPDAVILAHPECKPEVVEQADFSGSTSAMIKYVEKSSSHSQILLLTECAMGDNIIAANPHANLLRLCSVRCPHMAQITLEDTRDSLKFLQYEINLDPIIIEKARRSIDAMLAMS